MTSQQINASLEGRLQAREAELDTEPPSACARSNSARPSATSGSG
jgi:hypothetical protein